MYRAVKTTRMLSAGLVFLLVLGMMIFSGKVFENLDAEHILVVQSPAKGTLTWYLTPGIKWQGFGKVTQYPRRSFFEFKAPIRFNEGGHGTMEGSLQYEMPNNQEQLSALHMRFGNPDKVQNNLVETITGKSIYLSGPLMSSRESYAEKRNDLLYYVEDQIKNGVYKTRQRETKTKDPMTGADKTVMVAEIILGKDGIPERQEEAVLTVWGIHPFNFAIKALPYEEIVEEQIKQQQKLAMDVQTAIASAKKAEQEAITTAKQGEALAAKSKWEQEAIKAKVVVEAQQRLEIAEKDAMTAEQRKREQILLGEGESIRKRLVMEADGALNQKLDAFVKINECYAQAIEGYKGNWVPGVVMGENKEASSGSGATSIIQLLTAKIAKDLALDMGVFGQGATKRVADTVQ